MDTPNDDYDNPWKTGLVRYIREFFAIFCPGLEAAIDWSVEPTFHSSRLLLTRISRPCAPSGSRTSAWPKSCG
jgi:hypothetical protein